jgi:hypothetical protein
LYSLTILHPVLELELRLEQLARASERHYMTRGSRYAGERTGMASTSTVSSDLWIGRYPTAGAYFAELPDGWASFPTCLARASLVRSLRDRGVLEALDALPPPLGALLEHVSGSEDWIPEVVHVAALLAIRDARFGNSDRDDEQFLLWIEQLNRDLLGGSKHIDIPFGVTPDALVARLGDLWETFHRGTPITVTAQEITRVKIVIAHPRQLFARLSIESHRRTLALSLAKAGAVQPQVDVRTEPCGDKAETVFTASWS